MLHNYYKTTDGTYNVFITVDETNQATVVFPTYNGGALISGKATISDNHIRICDTVTVVSKHNPLGGMLEFLADMEVTSASAEDFISAVCGVAYIGTSITCVKGGCHSCQCSRS